MLWCSGSCRGLTPNREAATPTSENTPSAVEAEVRHVRAELPELERGSSNGRLGSRRRSRKLAKMQLSGELESMKTQMSAIVAEAQSFAPWTSRARSTFLYLMYALLLWSVPMRLLLAFHPDIANRITRG